MTRLALLFLAIPACTREVVLVDATTAIVEPGPAPEPGAAATAGAAAVEAHVRCAAPRTPGEPIGCSVSHDGARAYELCWAGEFRCKNATVLRAKTCRDAPPNVEIRELLGAAELAGWDSCDLVDEGRVSAAWVVDR